MFFKLISHWESKRAAYPLSKFTFSMVLKIIMDFKGQLTVARPSLSAGESVPHVHGLLALWSLTFQAGEPDGTGQRSDWSCAFRLLWGRCKDSGSSSSVVVKGPGHPRP